PRAAGALVAVDRRRFAPLGATRRRGAPCDAQARKAPALRERVRRPAVRGQEDAAPARAPAGGAARARRVERPVDGRAALPWGAAGRDRKSVVKGKSVYLEGGCMTRNN